MVVLTGSLSLRSFPLKALTMTMQGWECRCSCCHPMQFWRRRLWARSSHLVTADCQSTIPITGLVLVLCFQHSRSSVPYSRPGSVVTACKACNVAFMSLWLLSCLILVCANHFFWESKSSAPLSPPFPGPHQSPGRHLPSKGTRLMLPEAFTNVAWYTASTLHTANVARTHKQPRLHHHEHMKASWRTLMFALPTSTIGLNICAYKSCQHNLMQHSPPQVSVALPSSVASTTSCTISITHCAYKRSQHDLIRYNPPQADGDWTDSGERAGHGG